MSLRLLVAADSNDIQLCVQELVYPIKVAIILDQRNTQQEYMSNKTYGK